MPERLLINPVFLAGKMRKCSLSKVRISTPIGPYIVTACKIGLHGMGNAPEVNNDNFLDLGSSKIRAEEDDSGIESEIVPVFDRTVSWLESFFSTTGSDDPDVDTDLQICPEVIGDENSRSFKQLVWVTLREKVKPGTSILSARKKSWISFIECYFTGQTVSYGELARLCGKNGAARAVGTAMATNEIPLVVPCHRVVKADGSLGNYSKAKMNKMKEWLLKHEREKHARHFKKFHLNA